ncbi:MAG: Glu-tRNA(Gln) amidotransferase subunit GatE [Bacteroidetes bacterium]|nr:Glu-tRNA(Gln) amidotransferase subunit GatE [Bacteroidota bacterium]MCW5894979.1 Glu-tRNA(Gln) amidotransferase subunit GatE [Bacteroidota bacterium]
MYDFLFKPFHDMTASDYAAVGFTSGLEIHQQLLTSKKLFCRCPAGRYSDHYDAEILRHMRPTLSELGEYDGTALMEFKTKKNIIYRINRDTVCTYEMDDTPPFQINEEALDIALGIGMMYGCELVDELHIARKQYLDGSIPTGFQRTAIFSLNGIIPFKGREVRVVQMSIEEDSCREVSDIGHQRVYLTDRLGMPLIETVTGPDMKTPYEVAEVAELCRWMARSTGMVRTGIGAARQDVNVSVTGGTRVEIKGVPRIPHIPLLTYNEAMRQWNLLRLRDELHRRGITADAFQASTESVTKLLKKTRYLPLENALASGMIVNCVVLRGFRDLLRWQTQTDTFFSKEISDRVRVIACLTTLPNILHSDSPSESLATAEWQSIKKAVGATEDDTLVLVWGSEQDAATGAQEITIRAKEATIGIPSETRQALRDGTNGFERILPGADRMYPDTDLPPKRITDERRERIRAALPLDFWKREDRYRRLGVPEDLVQSLSVSRFAGLFDTLTGEWNILPKLAATLLIQFQKRLKREGLDNRIVDELMIKRIVKAYKEGRVARDGLYDIMKQAVRNGSFEESLLPVPCPIDELAKVVEETVAGLGGITIHHAEKRDEIVMGLVMNRLRGRVEGSTVREYVQREAR